MNDNGYSKPLLQQESSDSLGAEAFFRGFSPDNQRYSASLDEESVNEYSSNLTSPFSEISFSENDIKQDSLDKLIEITVTTYQKKKNKEIYENAFYKEHISNLLLEEVDKVSNKYHSAYLKFISFYVEFDKKFINTALTPQEVRNDGNNLLKFEGSVFEFEKHITEFLSTKVSSVTADLQKSNNELIELTSDFVEDVSVSSITSSHIKNHSVFRPVDTDSADYKPGSISPRN